MYGENEDGPLFVIAPDRKLPISGQYCDKWRPALRAFDNTITRDIAGNRVYDESIFIEKKREGKGKVEKSSCKLGYDTRNRRENIFSEGELVVDWT